MAHAEHDLRPPERVQFAARTGRADLFAEHGQELGAAGWTAGTDRAEARSGTRIAGAKTTVLLPGGGGYARLPGVRFRTLLGWERPAGPGLSPGIRVRAPIPHRIAADPVNAELLKELQMCSKRGTIHRRHRIHRILL
jgi:hypothetical protein